MNITRRDFLTTAAATAGAAATPDLSHSDEPHGHDHQVVPSDPALRTKALESLLVEKGLVDQAALDALIDTFEHKVGPRNGAKVVARAWVDPNYKARLLSDAASAIAEIGLGKSAVGDHTLVLENTPKVHNLVVCTLCSCYPWTGRVRSLIRVAFCASSGFNWTKTSKCVCGIAPRNCATSCFRSVRPEAKT